jgi:hypothetical protein
MEIGNAKGGVPISKVVMGPRQIAAIYGQCRLEQLEQDRLQMWKDPNSLEVGHRARLLKC